jgi:hypothetical protein
MKKRKLNTSLVLKFLTHSDMIDQEMVIGTYPFSEAETTSALELPSRETLLGGVRLIVSEPGGHRLTNCRLVRRISKELRRLFGGWFTYDLTPYIQLYDSLVSQQVRDKYRLGGMSINWDKPQKAFYFLSFSAASWQVQAVGELRIFHCIFFGQPLTRAEAIGGEVYPFFFQVDPVPSLLAEAMTKLSIHRLNDSTSKHASNLFHTYLEGYRIKVKAGIRMRLMKDGSEFPGDKPYFYGIRVNCDLREK